MSIISLDKTSFPKQLRHVDNHFIILQLPEVLVTGRQHAKIVIYQEETDCMMKEQKTCTHPCVIKWYAAILPFQTGGNKTGGNKQVETNMSWKDAPAAE